MELKREKVTFPSAASGVTVTGYLYLPDGSPRAIVQLAHGMLDHVGRYEEMIEALTAAGFAVVGNDHIGHGATAADREALGFFGRRGARWDIVSDLHRMSEIAKERLGDLPLLLVGHSMGSFLARLYAEKWGQELSALVLLGTAGKNPAVPFGKLLADLIRLFRGKRHRSRILTAITFMGYQSHYKEEHSHLSWLTRDPEYRKACAEDPLCHFLFTVSAYRELYAMLGEVNRRAWFRSIPPSLPVLLAAGEEDPVGAYGRGVRQVERSLRRAGVSDLRLLLYPGARHELHHETNRAEFFSDLVSYLSEVVE